MERRILKRKLKETEEEYAGRLSKMYAPHHSQSRTLEMSGSLLFGRFDAELILTWTHVGSRMCPKNILARTSLATAKECFLDCIMTLCSLNGEVFDTITNIPVSRRTLLLTTFRLTTSGLTLTDMKYTKTLIVSRSTPSRTHCNTLEPTIFSLTRESGDRVVMLIKH